MIGQGRRITVVEIRKRAEQGVTLPFFCKGDDHRWYWVKGNSAGRRALCCEWLAGRIAQALELPVPSFAQVDVPEQVLEYSTMGGIADLGSGLCFGSQHVENSAEFTMANLGSVDEALKIRLLAFDWWVQNEDRTLGPKGGNVNLLWTPSDAKLHVIDHNVAFDGAFDVDRFKANHVFAPDLDQASPFLVEIRNSMSDIAARLLDFWNELPENWIEEVTLPGDFNFDAVKRILDRFQDIEPLVGGQPK